MNTLGKILIKSLHRAYTDLFVNDSAYLRISDFNHDPDETSSLVRQFLESDKACMIARYGAFESALVSNYFGVKEQSVWKYIQGRQGPIWWEESLLRYMQSNAGFFPANIKNAERFCSLMVDDSAQLDVLAEWKGDYKKLEHILPANVALSHLACVEPFFAKHPWTSALAGKRVLVIHPFSQLIEKQYSEKRSLLFENKEMLPLFELQTIQAVQSIGGECSRFHDWFEALDWMKQEIDRCEYDICLLGCGAYGFPLAAHVKRSGKKAIHLGGSLQLLFGIIGNRWTNPRYGVKEWGIPEGLYSNLMNEFWVRPDIQYRPKNSQSIEGACYW